MALIIRTMYALLVTTRRGNSPNLHRATMH